MFVLSTYPPPPAPVQDSRFTQGRDTRRVDYLSVKTFLGGLNLHLGFSVFFLIHLPQSYLTQMSILKKGALISLIQFPVAAEWARKWMIKGGEKDGE